MIKQHLIATEAKVHRVQNFESLRKDGYVYIDKTALIHQLVSSGRYHFVENTEGLYNPFSLLNTFRMCCSSFSS